jgi:hypothetical protein
MEMAEACKSCRPHLWYTPTSRSNAMMQSKLFVRAASARDSSSAWKDSAIPTLIKPKRMPALPRCVCFSSFPGFLQTKKTCVRREVLSFCPSKWQSVLPRTTGDTSKNILKMLQKLIKKRPSGMSRRQVHVPIYRSAPEAWDLTAAPRHGGHALAYAFEVAA